MTQFYSRIDTEFNGDVYNIPFSYSKESEISVYLDDELFTDWYFLNESQIKFTELPSKTPEIVTIKRTTDITKKVVEYTNNTMLSKVALNLSQDQLLNAVQEIYDNNTQFEIDIEKNIQQNRAEIDTQVEENRQELLNQVSNNKIDTDKQISDLTDNVNSNINEFKSEINTDVANIQTEVDSANSKADSAITTAASANNKADSAVNTSNTAIDTANSALGIVNISNTTANKANSTANDALTVANNASTVANSAKERADETSNKVDEFETNISSVISAAEKINELEGAVEEAKTAANDAALSAIGAIEAADNATVAANKAIETAENVTGLLDDCALKSEIPTNNNQLTNGAGYITSDYHDSTKQDVISDLETIRQGASKGATALQSVPSEYITETELNAKGYLTSYTETDPIYTTDKPNIAKVDLSNLTEEGIKVIKDNSGSGLEVCDIGMSLYVDETKGLRRYLNGQIVDINTNTQAFLNRLKDITTLHPSLLCTEDEWQTAKTMSAFGQVGKFVFNYSGDEVVSVRVPAIVNVQGLFDLQNLGMTVAESLPNFKGSFSIYTSSNSYGTGTKQSTADGVFSVEHISGVGESYQTDSTRPKFTLDPSKTIEAYQDNAPVQQEAIQYPYFIQIATGAETENNIVNEIELNNPFSLLDYKYSEYELNNISWLCSEGQYNSKAVYPAVYDLLLKIYNGTETKTGVSVKLNTEAYTDYDFVLNTTDETFRLPLKVKLASGKAVVGNGISLGFTNGGALSYATDYSGYIVELGNAFGKQVDEFAQSGVAISTSAKSYNALGITTDPTKSGIETSDQGLYLYFYVGETVQNANLIDAGRIGEQLSGLVEVGGSLSMPSSKYIDLTLGASGSIYTAPADGYLAFDGTAPNTSEGSHAGMQNLTLGNFAVDSLNIWGRRTACIMPVRKNDQVKITFSNATSLRLYLLQGDKGEL